MDDVEACVPELRLDFWEKQAFARAGERGPRAVRRMVTTWRDPYDHVRNLNDYARREYAGLMRAYYQKRWEALFDCTDANGNLDRRRFGATLNALEKSFVDNGTKEEPVPQDNLAALVTRSKAALAIE